MLCLVGSSGFLGSNLKYYLGQREIPFMTFDRVDGFDWAVWSGEQWLPKNAVVINMAAIVGIYKSSIHKDVVLNNVAIAKNVGIACALSCSKLVHISSYVYGNSKYLPVNEFSPVLASNLYMESKIESERAIFALKESHGLNSVVLRPFNLYGPGQPKHFIIPTIIEALLRREPLEIESLGSSRDYVFTNDMCSAILRVSQCIDRLSGVYNVCTGKETTNIELYQLIRDLMGGDVDVLARDSASVSRAVGDGTKLLNEAGWRPETDLTRGLKETISSYANFYSVNSRS